MDQSQVTQGTTFPGLQPEELDRIATWMEQLLEGDLTAEAVTRFFRLRPPDQADVMSRLTRESQAKLLSLLTPKSLGMIVEELKPMDVVELSHEMDPQRLSEVLDETSPDVAADILRGLPEEAATRTLEYMKDAEGVSPLLEYEDDDAGGLMTPDFIALREGMTVMQAMSFVRGNGSELASEDISYLFVVNRDGVLKGGISLSQLVLAMPHQDVSLLMYPEVISVPTETDQEECAHLMEHYNLRTLPVVNDEGKLVGVLNIENMIDVFQDEATEDMYRMIGVGEEEKALGSFWRAVRSRLPWLFLNLGTAILAGLVITMFQSTMARAVALAAFLPVIAGQGGIAGTQTLTLIVRSMALGEISTANAKRLLIKEAGLGLVHGLALGALVGVIALLWMGSEYLALVVALAMLSNMIVAGVSGVIVPLGLRTLRIDPALASAVAVTTVTDVVGFLVYLGLAALMIGLIVGSL